MKVLKTAAILLFALTFTLSIIAFLWCNFTPEGKLRKMEHSQAGADHVAVY